ncbi:hypothetical protein FACS189418_0160 [Clostridia bacterium]|nr:hypothetical protein FACS189418_0160 [Clostridia bacterium]
MRKFKILLSLTLVFVLFLEGCGISQVSALPFFGPGKDELLKIGGEGFAISEGIVFISSQKQMYEDIYGAQIWSASVLDSTYEQYFLEQVKKFLMQMTCLTILAKEQGIILNTKEKEQVSQATRLYLENLSAGEQSKMSSSVMKAYEDYTLAQKVLKMSIENKELEVSDDQAKVIVLKQIVLKKYTLNEQGKKIFFDAQTLEEKRALIRFCAEQVKVQKKNFDSVANQFSEEFPVEQPYQKGVLDKKTESQVFALEKGEISEAIETEDALYVFQCENDYDKEATKKHKALLIQEKKELKFQEIYTQVISNYPAEFNDGAWNNLHLSEMQALSSKNFFSIYQEVQSGQSTEYVLGK